MDLRDSLLIFITVLNIGLGVLVLSRNWKNRINITYSLVVLSAAGWSFGLAYFRMANDLDRALFWARFYYLAAAAIGYAFLLFGLVFPYQKTKLRARKAVLLFLPFLLVSILIYTRYHIENVFITPWGKDVIFGWNYALYTVYFIMYMGWGFLALWRKQRESSGIRKTQARYVILGMLPAAAGGSIFNLILPLLGNYRYIWLGPVFILIMIVFIGYAIARYRLMDIRTVVFRSLAFSVIVLVLSILVVFLSALTTLLLGAESVVWSSLAPAVVLALAFQPLSKFIERVTNKILYKQTYNPDELLANITSATSSLLNLDDLLSKIAHGLIEAFHSEKIGFALLSKSGRLDVAFSQNFSETETGKILNYPDVIGIMVHQFGALGPIIAIDELKIRFDNGDYVPAAPGLLNLLYEFNVALLVALKDKEKLLGVLALGNKKSGDQYNMHDLSILKIIASHISVAVNNALLYDESQQFNIKLKDEIAKATDDLRKANEELKRLDQAKSEFLSIAAHQLRTPLTGIKGYISMFLEGDFGSLTPQQKQEMEQIFRSSDRLTRLIDVFLNISRIETGRLDVTKSKTQFMSIVDDVLNDLDGQIKKRGLKLTVQKPEEPLPEMMLDRDKIQDVVTNLIDNAVKYTPQGWINVRIQRSPSLLTFQVQDSGIGIDPAEIDKLFQKFSRAEAVTRIHTGGSGLGLFIAKKIIEAHGGRIWAESEGQSKGSVFVFTLPIITNEKT